VIDERRSRQERRANQSKDEGPEECRSLGRGEPCTDIGLRLREAVPRVFLDCDGVLADFDKGAAGVFGMPPAEYERRFGLKRFWSALAATPDFFNTLDLLPDAMELFDAVRPLRPIILTGLPRGAWAEPQKRRWATRHFPGIEVITTRAALKREHCYPGDALVDDRDRYHHLWEKAGGIFIHHRSAAASVEQLRQHGYL
jgi:hypothetical protein